MKSPKPGSVVKSFGKSFIVESMEKSEAYLTARSAFNKLSKKERAAAFEALLKKPKK